VSILANWGGAGARGHARGAARLADKAPRRLYTFALDAPQRCRLAAPRRPCPSATPHSWSRRAGGEGRQIYALVRCHGGGAVSGGSAPDLRASILCRGTSRRGGPGERSRRACRVPLPAELDGLMSYIRTRARESLQAAAGGEESAERQH
jgi:hypothetical protein